MRGKPLYFRGTTVTGSVRASEEKTFAEVVESFQGCTTLGLTRSAYFALNKEGRDAAKEVPFYTPACFRESPSKRNYAAATHCNLLFLDIDVEKDGTCPAAPFVEKPEILNSALPEFNFAAYTTASSTPEKPRLRIVIDAEAIPMELYSRAVLTLCSMLGLENMKSVRESKVAVQPMYGPTLFSDSPESEHPLIASRTDARAFTVADIATPATNGHSVNGKNGHSSNGSNGHSIPVSLDALDFLRAPVPEITLGMAKEAINHIDPDCTRHAWLEHAAALKHQFSPHHVEDAYSLFDEWSATGEKYVDADDTLKTWDSLQPTPVGRLPVTIRTLLRRAVESGWNDSRARESVFQKTVAWMEEVKNFTELLEKGVQRIVASPLITASQEDLLIREVCRQAKRRFGFVISAAAIRKDLTRLKAEVKKAQGEQAKHKIPTWAKGIVYVESTKDFYRHHTSERISREAFNASNGRNLDSDFMQQPSDYVLNQLLIPTVYDYAYSPSRPTEVLFTEKGKKYVNTYFPSYPEEDPPNAARAGAMLQGHLRNLIAESDYRRTLTDFMAYIVQNPGKKIRWAVLIQSVEGAGKTYLAQVMAAVLGEEHVRIINGSSVKSGFNEWSFGAQLVVMEEIRVAGTNRHEMMNTLKEAITNDRIPVNEKFRNTRQVENITNYILFSNHHDALAITPGDRRYFVLKSLLQNKAQVMALGDNYFPPLYALLREHPGALRAYLAEWEISPDFSANNGAPRTKYTQEMITDSASDLTSSVRRLLLEANYPLVQYDIASSKSLLDVLHIEEAMPRVTAQYLAQVLREEGLTQIGQHMLNGERHYLWIRDGVDKGMAPAVAAERLKTNSKNLCMELLF